MVITDEMLSAFNAGWVEHVCDPLPPPASAGPCCTRSALARVAPLIAAQALREAAGYLAITHRHLNLHDRMGANLSCDGCRILRAIER